MEGKVNGGQLDLKSLQSTEHGDYHHDFGMI
jgi:hypothetical protein